MQGTYQFTLDEYAATKAREEAIAQVGLNADCAWKDIALQVVADVAEEWAEFTTDEVLERLADKTVSTHEMRALGPVMMAAQKAGIIMPSDTFVKSKAVSRHCAPKRVWRSCRFAGA